jgi:tetratricopeptide (TPR) repeat protein
LTFPLHFLNGKEAKNDHKINTLIPPLLAGILAWVLYELTNADGLFWGDSGEFITVSKILGIGHAYGHPLFWITGRIGTLLFPGNPASSVNHMVTFTAAFTVFMLALMIQGRLTANQNLSDRLIITLISLGIYITGITIWVQATYAEVYHLHTLMIVLHLFCLDKYFLQKGPVSWLMGAAYFFGLALTLGQYTALLLILIPLFAWAGRRSLKIGFKSTGFILLTFFLGLSIWIFLPVRSALNPPVLTSQINSLSDFMNYLTRADYQNWTPAGWAAVPFGLKMAVRICLDNLSVLGIIALVVWIISLYWKRDLRPLPWFLGALFYAAFCGILVPLTMTAVQMNEMDVYLIPAIVLAIPVIAAGIQVSFSVMRKSLRPFLILPVVLLIISNWPKANISGTNNADRFVHYLRESLPDSVRVLPATDNVIFPLWYFQYADENRKALILEPNRLSEWTPGNSADFIGVTPLLIEMDGAFFNTLGFLDQPVLAGPLAAFHWDAQRASRIDSVFLGEFSFHAEGTGHFTQLDRLNIAKLWYNRARYFFTRWQMLENTHPDQGRFWKEAISAYSQTALLDDFSSVGAEVRARLALMYVNSGRPEEGLTLAHEAIRISPLVTEAYRALFSIAYSRSDYPAAIRQLKRLIRLDPEDGNIWMDLAFCYEKNGQLYQARKSYQKGLAFGGEPRKSLAAKLSIQ